jgi:ABC-type glutathione transport system ATPase component
MDTDVNVKTVGGIRVTSTNEDLINSTPTSPEAVFSVRDLSVYYGPFLAVRNVDIDIHEREITAFIGP